MPHRYELPIMSFVSIILVLLPSPWHWKARNVATLSLIAWLIIINLVRGINSIIWMDNVRIHIRWWCDISSKIIIGVTVALPACSFCITRHLEHVASTRVAVTTAADRKRRRIVDLFIAIGIPVLVMVLHYIVQGHRFDILEDIGCQPSTYVSIPAIFLLWAPPLVLSAGSLINAALALRHFAIRRLEFEQHLRDSKSALTTGRYMRLMALALTEMLWGSSLGAYVVYLNIRETGLRPWISWQNVHYNFSRVAIFPSFLLTDFQRDRLLLTWWISPTTAILFFLFFGFSEEALEGYGGAVRWLRRKILRQNVAQKRLDSYGKGSALPRFHPPTYASATQPDDMILDFPDSKFGAGRELDLNHLRPVDAETSSALSLTLPGLECDLPSEPGSARIPNGVQAHPSRSPSPTRSVSPTLPGTEHVIHLPLRREAV